MTGWIDTHAHMCDALFDPDRGEVLRRAEQAGLRRIVTVGETLADARANLALARRYPLLQPAAGLYPAHVDETQAELMCAWIRRHRSELVAVGEVGLDFWVVQQEAARRRQEEIFKMFIALAKELDLVLNVHSRSAGRHAVALLCNQGAQRVHLHAFDGKAAAAMPAVEAGYFFSIPPSVVRSRQKQKLVKRLPLANLLLETDSPVLGPDPQQRNEPAHITAAADAIAALKKIGIEEVAGVTARNACRLYGCNQPFRADRVRRDGGS